MDTSGFYKNDNGEVLFGPNYVVSLNYNLFKEQKDEHTYPIDGWYWFDSIEEAYSFFGIELPQNT